MFKINEYAEVNSLNLHSLNISFRTNYKDEVSAERNNHAIDNYSVVDMEITSEGDESGTRAEENTSEC